MTEVTEMAGEGFVLEQTSQEELSKQELKALKDRANLIGLKFHPSIGLKKLKDKVNDQLKKDARQLANEKRQAAQATQHQQPLPANVQTFTSPDGFVKRETPAQRKVRLRKKASRLIRFRLTCMNEAKKKWPGEIFTVSNSIVGTFKRFIPFNADAWHCEEMLLKVLQDREYAMYIPYKDAKGRERKRVQMAKEFAVQILPPLTAQELNDLRVAQATSNRIGD